MPRTVDLLHVYPMGQQHLISLDCWCQPVVYSRDNEAVAVHRSRSVVTEKAERPTAQVLNPNYGTVQ